jgi:predicted nucleic acid-binding protein
MKKIVLDANIGLAFVISLPYSQAAYQQMLIWRSEKARVLIPMLWIYEVLSGLHRAVFLGLLKDEKKLSAWMEIEKLGFEQIAPLPETNRLAFNWAKQLGQKKAYDAQYLALADYAGADFYTADQALVNWAKGKGIAWVHGLPDGIEISSK